MQALRRSLLVVMTTWTLCAFTAPPAYAQVVAGSQVVNSTNVVVAS